MTASNTATNNSLRAVAYTRVSTNGQADTGTSLPEQLAACCLKAEQIGALIVRHCEDAGVSGGLYLSRPGLQEALAALESGEANTLIIANLSRFSRDREHQSAIKKRVEAASATLIFCDMDFAATPEGDLAFGILGSFAEYEKRVIRARTMKGRRERALSGVQPTRTRSPYGYHIVSKNDVAIGAYRESQLGQYVILEEQAAWVRVMYQRVHEGMSLYSLARFLNAQKAPQNVHSWQDESARYREWKQCNIRAILLNPVHKGMPVWGRKERMMDESRTQQGLTAFYYRDKPESAQVHLSCPAIVSADLWESAVSRIHNNRSTLSGNPIRKYLLSGFLRCPVCGGALNGITDRGEGNYICAARRGRMVGTEGAPVCETGTHYPSQTLETLFTDGLTCLAEKPERVASVIRGYRDYAEMQRRNSPAPLLQPRLDALRAEIANLSRSEKSTILAQVASVRAGADPLVYLEVLQDLSRAKAALVRQASEMEEMLARESSPPAPSVAASEALSQTAALVRESLVSSRLSTQEKREILERFPRGLLQCVPKGKEGLSIMIGLPAEKGDLISSFVSNHQFKDGRGGHTGLPRLVVTCHVGHPPVITVEGGRHGR